MSQNLLRFTRIRQWVDIGERNRHYHPLMWITYPDAPLTVSEAYDKTIQNRIIMMHRHEEDKVVAQIWVPSFKALQEK